MKHINRLIKRTPLKFSPNPKRIICRPFNDNEVKIKKIFDLISKMGDEEIEKMDNRLMKEFSWRHRNFNQILADRYREIAPVLPSGVSLSQERKNMLASYFIMEYSIEAAALFNPSIVLHPDQAGLAKGSAQFIMSLRATGEGHISSIEFMSGEVDAQGQLKLEEVSRFATSPAEICVDCENPGTVEIKFDPQTDLSERVIFPVSADESNGIEDVRLVRFEDARKVTYYGTFTAYDGHQIKSKLLETKDFIHFKIHTMNGAAIKDKGMALFPRKINGRYAMISRQDDFNIRIMFSDDILHWEQSKILREPQMPWEFVKSGNIGSPLETDQGWLLLTHGVGAMRKYVISACLLDKNDPTKVISQFKKPLLSPNEDEREGYVPNVVYSCGAMIHRGKLILPYAMSDAVSGFAIADVQTLIKQME